MLRVVFIFLLSVFVLSTNTFAQKKLKEHKIKNAVGEAIGGPTNTPIEVKQMAINNAKIEALKKAGIEEHINSYTDYFRSEASGQMDEIFTKDIISNIRGSVINVEEIKDGFKQSFSPEGNIKVSVSINCTVLEYLTPKDLEFDVWVEGIKKIYKEGDSLSFEVKPTVECYVRAFMFTKKEDFVLFPNEYENSILIPKLATQRFPTFDGTYEVDAGGENRELNRLILVFLKKDIPYTGEVAYKHITSWIMTIPPDERIIKSFSMDVYKDVD